mmetsp:Transcript_33363/g.51165  ORF Transcript_33363/g.51165 Transcript_33363/m.51165 type:complete len:110 (-) Transcript_33363:1219-1548(-)
MKERLFDRMHDLMAKEIEKKCGAEYKKFLETHHSEKEEVQSTTVHPGIICDNCDANPVVGIRYKCAIRQNYDLCAKCEEKLQPMYPMLKIRHPSQAPAQLICVLKPETA